MRFTYILSPAYGKDYKNESDAVEAFKSGTDFINETQRFTGGGTYISIRDIKLSTGIPTPFNFGYVQIRYNRRQKVAFLTTEKA